MDLRGNEEIILSVDSLRLIGVNYITLCGILLVLVEKGNTILSGILLSCK